VSHGSKLEKLHKVENHDPERSVDEINITSEEEEEDPNDVALREEFLRLERELEVLKT